MSTIKRVIRGIRDKIPAGYMLARQSAGEGQVELLKITDVLKGAGGSAANIQTLLDAIGSTRGAILERGSTGWVLITPGTSGFFLKSAGTGADPLWAAVTDALLVLGDITNNNVTSAAHGFAPKSPNDATKFLNGAAAPAFAQVKDSDLSTSDITTNNVTTAKHGFTPKLPNDATKYLDGTGSYSIPTGSASFSGFAIWGFHPLQYATNGIAVANALPANGGSMLCPIEVTAPMSLQGISFRNTDSATARSMEWRLYLDTNSSATANEVAGANGTDSWTPVAGSTRDVACGSPPISLNPGLYWLVIRNTHATSTLGIGSGAATNGLVPTYVKNQTLGSALGSTLDLDTSWGTGVFGNAIPAVRLNGRVLGKTALWS